MPAKAPSAPPKPAPPAKVNIILAPPKQRGKSVCLYGPGGIGKTSLVAMLDGIVWFDLDDSLSTLAETEPELAKAVCGPCGTFAQILDVLNSDAIKQAKVIAIDSATKCEELAVAHTVLTVPHEKGHTIKSIEDYGWGRGYQHVFDTFMTLIWTLERHRRDGKHIILTAHDCTTTVPNPQGEDWIRYEPRLQDPRSGKASIRLRLREWVDYLLYIGYDVNVDNGKAQGSGTRTIYPVEMPHCMAKARGLDDPIVYERGDDTLWRLIGLKGDK